MPYLPTTLERYLQDSLADRSLSDRLFVDRMGSTTFLSKPRLGARPAYAHVSTDKENYHARNKKAKIRKVSPKMADYGIRKRLPDYSELAYKEAVSRLRYFLSESYVPSSRSSKVGAASIKNLDESGDEMYDVIPRQSVFNPLGYQRHYTPVLPRRYPRPIDINIPLASSTAVPPGPPPAPHKLSQDPELMGFIQKQEDYIEQLERESSYCREELNSLLNKVKEVISENETLHERQKEQLLEPRGRSSRAAVGSESEDNDGDSTAGESDAKYSSVKVKKPSSKSTTRLEGPNIVFESKISELEAQLTQANIDLQKVQEENNEIRRKLSEGIVDSPCLDSFKRQIDNLQRDKSALESQVSRLKESLSERKHDDLSVVSRAQRDADLAHQAAHDRTQLEAEVRRVKEELDRQQRRVRELLSEQARRALEERSYSCRVEQLTSDLTTHWDSATKLQLELERQKREESELKRELSQKNSQIEDLKLELKNKISSLQADIAQSQADRAALEEELAGARLLLERHQRQAKHDTNRLNSEVQSVRQRLDRADADLVHSRRENLRLVDQLSNMEKEMNLRNLRPASPIKDKDAPKEPQISQLIQGMESKHAQTVSSLEALVRSQKTLMEKLSQECHMLTDKLDDASHRHKQEMAALQNNVEQLSATVARSNLASSPITDRTAGVPSNLRSNGDQHSNERNSATTRTAGPQSSAAREVEDSTTYKQTQPNERFEKQLKQSEHAKQQSPEITSRIDIDDKEHNVESSQHNVVKEQEVFGEPNEGNEPVMEYAEGNAYDADSQQYEQQYAQPEYATDANGQYAQNEGYVDGQYADQSYANQGESYAADPNQTYEVDPNAAYQTEQFDPSQGYADGQQYAEGQYADPNQQQYDASQQEYAEYTETPQDQQYTSEQQQ